MNSADFDYALPPALIATEPPAARRDSRLLVVDTAGRRLADRHFAGLPDYLRAGDLLVFNDTRVIKARLTGRKASGGAIEILIERILTPLSARVQIRASKSPPPGTVLHLSAGHTATVTGRDRGFYELRFSGDLKALLDQIGDVPLPPYIGRQAEAADSERYQTVYARRPGAVAAPTAGLHFDERMMEETRQAGVRHAFVTLHVGAGTFQPLRREQVETNRLHAERVTVDEATCEAVRQTRANGGRVVAVGTTSVRALECASRAGGIRPFDGDTDLFIYPGYRFQSVDMLLTNFHLPRSSLLLLVAAFGGTDLILGSYRHAVAQRYRFFSYGDAMLILGDDAHAGRQD